MSAKPTRSSKLKQESPKDLKKSAKAPAAFKVFYIPEKLLTEETCELQLERLYHPGQNGLAWFITNADNTVLEILEFAEPRRSWLIDNEISSNGRIYITTPIDITFLVLHQLRKHCSSKAQELETIYDDQDSSVKRLLTRFGPKAQLSCISDRKCVGDMTFYKYNPSKAKAWLALKAKRLADSLKKANIHCGRSALSQNYTRSEKEAEETVHDLDHLRMACDIIGGYLDLELHDELIQYLNIPKEVKTAEDTDSNGKRKSLTILKGGKNKKQKVDNLERDTGAAEKLKDSCLLDESLDDENIASKISPTNISPVIPKPTPLKERVLTTKEKALAKGAKGTKSIASFFKK